jgi:hypothetical protein
MNFLKYYLAIILVITMNSFLFSQEQMIVKPKVYNPERFINHNNSGNTINTSGFTVSGLNVVTQYPNVRVFNSPYNQTEPSISVSPSNSNNIFIGANTDFGMGYYSSFNSGLNYSGGDIMPGSVYYSTNPYVVHNNTGVLYFNYFDDYIVTDRSFNN